MVWQDVGFVACDVLVSVWDWQDIRFVACVLLVFARGMARHTVDGLVSM